ncbi:predicted protein [Haematococcus lacustris]|uniref:Uncharacterized protein n=1 Tax=Haematococcus lacustris TaxID=44745 RepID=A0A6A0A6T6_HAELA|nr:predicted protein [Haematococcus lacustris]
MASRDRRRLKGSLTRWLEEARESRRRTEVLRACIKRKKVAFQLFKAWYWDSFSADVQLPSKRQHSSAPPLSLPGS